MSYTATRSIKGSDSGVSAGREPGLSGGRTVPAVLSRKTGALINYNVQSRAMGTKGGGGYEVVDPDRRAARHAGDEVDDPNGAERVAGLGDDRRRGVSVGQALGGGAQPQLAGSGGASVDHGRVPLSDTRDWGSDGSTGRAARRRPRPGSR